MTWMKQRVVSLKKSRHSPCFKKRNPSKSGSTALLLPSKNPPPYYFFPEEFHVFLPCELKVLVNGQLLKPDEERRRKKQELGDLLRIFVWKNWG